MEKKVVCYAAQLGGCSNKQSYEHYISKGIFTNKMLTIEGQSWLKGESKTVNKEKVGIPILCEKHNNSLYLIDNAGKHFTKKVTECINLNFERDKFKRNKLFPKITHNINGRTLEQWMIKCALGSIFEDKSLRWHPNNSEPDKPPLDFLESLFGLRKLEEPKGLYLTMAEGETFNSMEISGVMHLRHPETDGCVAVLINLWNYKFMLWFSDLPMNYNFSSYINFRGDKEFIFGPGHHSPAYHPTELFFAGKGKLNSVINLDWSQEPIKINLDI